MLAFDITFTSTVATTSEPTTHTFLDVTPHGTFLSQFRYSLPYDEMAKALAFLKQTAKSHRQREDGTGLPDSGPKPDTNTPKLSNLPLELIIMIAEMASTQSAACLSLCNRAMSQILGPNIWRCLSLQSPEIRASFLYDLSKDLPQYFVCYRCVKLHASSAVQWPRTIPNTLTHCLEEEPAFVHCSESRTFLRFPHIQLAMDRHYLGTSHGFPLEAFQSTEFMVNTLFKTLALLSVDTEIVSNELLMRSQYWVIAPHNKRDELMSWYTLHDLLCPHIWTYGFNENELQTLIKSRLDVLQEHGQCCTSTAQCFRCPMDFVVDVVDLGKGRIAACFTRWINLGAGLHPTDPKWRCHLDTSLPQGVTYEPHPLGSIRSSFENQTAISLVDFTARNIYNLLSRPKLKLFTRRADGFMWKRVDPGRYRWHWYLEPAEPRYLSKIRRFFSWPPAQRSEELSSMEKGLP